MHDDSRCFCPRPASLCSDPSLHGSPCPEGAVKWGPPALAVRVRRCRGPGHALPDPCTQDPRAHTHPTAPARRQGPPIFEATPTRPSESSAHFVALWARGAVRALLPCALPRGSVPPTFPLARTERRNTRPPQHPPPWTPPPLLSSNACLPHVPVAVTVRRGVVFMCPKLAFSPGVPIALHQRLDQP